MLNRLLTDLEMQKKQSTFVFYSTTPSERSKSRQVINRHIARLEKEKRETLRRQRLTDQDRSQPPKIIADRIDAPSNSPWPKSQNSLIRTLGASSYYPFVPTSDKPPEAWTGCHHYLDNLIWQDNAALGLSPAQGRNRTEAMTRWVLSYDLIFHALVAWTLCCLPESQDSSTSIGQQLLCHRACTLRMLHERLSNGVVDDVLIQGIGLLIPIDDHLGYTEFNQAHLNGIERIIERRGGFAAVGSSEPALGLHLAALVSISTTKLSINTASSAGHMHITSFADWPAVDPSLASPIYASTPLHLAANVARLPSGFVSLITSGRLSNDMVTILVEFDKWLHSLSQTSPGGPEPMAYRFNVPSGLSSLEKHICTALICLTDDLTTMGTLYAALIFRKPLKRTKALLAELNALWTSYDMTASNKVPSADDVLIWLATIIPTPRRPELTPKNARRALYGRLMSRKPWLSDWANVETILGRFFYSSTRSAAWKESWKDYWDMDKTPSFLT